MPSIVDTTVLSNFAQIRRPDLLRVVYPDLAAPITVWNDLDLGVRRGLVPVCDWSWLATLDLTEREQAQATRDRPGPEARRSGLHRGSRYLRIPHALR